MHNLLQSLSNHMHNHVMLDRTITTLDCIMYFYGSTKIWLGTLTIHMVIGPQVLNKKYLPRALNQAPIDSSISVPDFEMSCRDLAISWDISSSSNGCRVSCTIKNNTMKQTVTVPVINELIPPLATIRPEWFTGDLSPVSLIVSGHPFVMEIQRWPPPPE